MNKLINERIMFQMAGENQLLQWKFKSQEVYFNKCKVET